jgi:hypothetical protein
MTALVLVLVLVSFAIALAVIQDVGRDAEERLDVYLRAAREQEDDDDRLAA